MEHLEHSAMEEELNKLEYGKRNYFSRFFLYSNIFFNSFKKQSEILY